MVVLSPWMDGGLRRWRDGDDAEMVKLTKAMCWEMVSKTSDTVDQVGLVTFRKPADNACYMKRRQKEPPLCEPSDDPNAAWYVTCLWILLVWVLTAFSQQFKLSFTHANNILPRSI